MAFASQCKHWGDDANELRAGCLHLGLVVSFHQKRMGLVDLEQRAPDCQGLALVTILCRIEVNVGPSLLACRLTNSLACLLVLSTNQSPPISHHSLELGPPADPLHILPALTDEEPYLLQTKHAALRHEVINRMDWALF